MKRWSLIFGGVLFAAFIGFRLYQEWPAEESAGFGGMPPGGFGRSVGAAVVELGPVSESVTLVGSLRAQERVDVTPKINGRLISVRVDIGDEVTRGQLLAQLEDEELQQQVQQSDAALDVSRAVVNQRELELKNQQAILDRTRGLHDSGLISSEELEQTQTRYDVAQAQLNLARAQLVQAEAGLRELRIRLDQTRVVAPIAGLVGRRFVDPGALVNANTPVVTLVKLDNVELVAGVPERDLAKVVVGAAGEVFVDALPGVSFSGTVARISPLLDPQTRTAQVEVVIANPQLRLKAEMFARVELDLGSKREALRIPRDALVVRGQQQGVFLVNEATASFREIQIGIAEDDWVEVTAGLELGDTVATLGANLLRDGDPVRVSGRRASEETSA